MYYDEGISGTKKETRPALMRMITDCEAGKIDKILTKSLSRFARNTTDCIELVQKLLNLGISNLFEKENIDTGTMESDFLLFVMSSLAKGEAVSISNNEKWSIKHRFKTGTFKVSYAPFGYDVNDGEFTINEEEAKWVRWIFAEAISGKCSTEIAKILNEKRVPTKRGGKWGATTIRGMLKNEKYYAHCSDIYQRTHWLVHDENVIFWRCTSRLRKKSSGIECPARAIKETELHATVVKAVNQVMENKDELLKEARKRIEKESKIRGSF